jgi:hypothetical protein
MDIATYASVATLPRTVVQFKEHSFFIEPDYSILDLSSIGPVSSIAQRVFCRRSVIEFSSPQRGSMTFGDEPVRNDPSVSVIFTVSGLLVYQFR